MPGATTAEAVLNLHGLLQDLQLGIADLAYTAHETTHGLIQDFATASRFGGTLPGVATMRAATHRLNMGNDLISGAAGDDFIVGDNGFVAMKGVGATSAAGALTAAQRSSIDTALGAQNKTRDAQLLAHLDKDHADNRQEHLTAGTAAGQWLFERGQPFQITIGNDVMSGGDGRDVLIGDYSFGAAPVLLDRLVGAATPANATRELDVTNTALARALFLEGNAYRGINTEANPTGAYMLKQVAKDWSYDGGYNFWWSDMSATDSRKNLKPAADAIVYNSDTINGDAGDDLIVGDTALVQPVFTAADPLGATRQFSIVPVAETGFTTAFLDRYIYAFGPFGRLHPPSDASGLKAEAYGVDADTISGGDGNDIVFGQFGTDKLYGNAGDDKLSGGDGNDLMNGGAGKNYLAMRVGADSYVKNGGVDSNVTRLTVTAAEVQFTWSTPLVAAIATDMSENRAKLQQAGSAWIRGASNSTSGVATSAGPNVISQSTLAPLSVSSVISAIKSSEIVLRMVAPTANADTPVDDLLVLDPTTGKFVTRWQMRLASTLVPTESPVLPRHPSIVTSIRGWLGTDATTGRII
jgi:Ca2+-binding RTX toxin-like protein